jgi:hypothetical protein
MGEFLIDTPYHKRWYLPNRDFAFNSVIYGDDIRCSVIRLRDGRTMESATYSFTKHENWSELCDLFVELASKKYKRQMLPRAERRAELFRSQHHDKSV